MEVSVETFQTYIVDNFNGVKDRWAKRYKAGIVPASFSLFQNIIDLWYLQEDRTSRLEP